jgi:UDP-hydrolysing UDP-N-acetyl-D-glucosamine 2-epimerase
VRLHIAAVTGSRADFGPLQPLLVGMRDEPRIRLSTIVSAVAARDEAEGQVTAMTRVGLTPDAVVTTEERGPHLPMAAQAARALDGVASRLEELGPDLVVLLGDRFEILAAATAAHLLRIPIVHLSGGDETLGSLDDAMRHAISRLASLHLPTNDESARRLRALGVPADRIFVAGSTALDALTAFTPLDRNDLGTELGVELGEQVITVTYHAATLADEPPVDTFEALMAGISDAAPNATVVVTSSNADEGGTAIDTAAVAAAAANPLVTLVRSLGTVRYWSLLHHSDAVVGNSSSALIEAPVVGVPVVDVGARQASRLRAESCIHAPAERDAIAAAVAVALSRPRNPEASPYGDGRAVPRILELLCALDDPSKLLEPRPLLPVAR